jgi:hypothetical protein
MQDPSGRPARPLVSANTFLLAKLPSSASKSKNHSELSGVREIESATIRTEGYAVRHDDAIHAWRDVAAGINAEKPSFRHELVLAH